MPSKTILLCAVAWAVMASPCAFAQAGGPLADDRPAAAPAPSHAAKAPRRMKRAAAARSAAPAAPQQAYDLVPRGQPTSALTRARQNSFGTVDDDPADPGRGRGRVGIGLGGAGGATPGMQIGF